MTPTHVLGIDSSTQSCKALLVDAATGEIVASSRQPHLPGTQINPERWIEALEASAGGLIDRAAALSVAGQQHGMVALDARNEPVRDAMLWNDVSSARRPRSWAVNWEVPKLPPTRSAASWWRR